MKRLFLVLIIFGIVPGMQAQLESFRNHSTTLIQIKSSSFDEIEGSPYFGNEEFEHGVLKIDEIDLEAYFRYNVRDERMEIKMEPTDGDVYHLSPSENAIYEFGKKKYSWDKLTYEGENFRGYFIKSYDGESVSVLTKPVVHITEAVKARTGYGKDKPARIDVRKKHFLIFSDGRVEEVRSKERDLRKAFNSSEVKDFLKDHRVRSVEDIVSVAIFYDGLAQ